MVGADTADFSSEPGSIPDNGPMAQELFQQERRAKLLEGLTGIVRLANREWYDLLETAEEDRSSKAWWRVSEAARNADEQLARLEVEKLKNSRRSLGNIGKQS
jgi:hypothetical protein